MKGCETVKDFLLKKIALPTVVLIWAASYYIEVMGYSVKNHRMIQPLFWVMVVLYIVNGITDYREWKREQAASAAESEEEKEAASALKTIDKKQTARLVVLVSSMIAYVALLNTLGFIITTFLFTCGVLFVMGERTWYKLAGIPAVLVAFLYVVFKLGLSIPLPAGFLPF